MLRRNLIANFIGQGWTAVMGLAFVPLYIKYIGIESYGLIGVFAIIQAWLALLDMGLVPALSREMSRFTGGGHSADSIWSLLRSVEILLFGVSLLFVFIVYVFSGWVSSSWLNAEKLSPDVVRDAVLIMGVVAGLRLLENIYKSSLIGLQQQLVFNVVNSSLATMRGAGSVAVLAWYSPTVSAFFFWQAIVSVVSVIVMILMVYRYMPLSSRSPRFSMGSLRQISGFAGGVVGVTFLALLLTQVDKVLLSKLLPLSEFGYYSLAALLANGLFLIAGPINQAFFPRFSELYSRQSNAELADAFHLGAQLLTVIFGAGAVLLICFSEFVLNLWTRDPELARSVAPLVSILSLGSLLNGLLWIPYQMQLAHGWTGLAVRINTVAVVLVVPAIIWVTPRYGAVGVAWVWVLLNTGYLLVGIHFMFRKIMLGEKRRWYVEDVFVPVFFGGITAFLLKFVFGDVSVLGFLMSALTVLSVFVLSANRVRALLVKRFFLSLD